MFQDRDFLVIFAGFMLWFLFGYTESVGMPFMNLHFWGLQTEELAYFGIVSLLGLPVAFALVPWITQTFDKRNTMIGSSLVYLILPNIPICLRLLEVPWFPDNSSPWILYITLAVAFVNAGSGTIAAVTYSSFMRTCQTPTSFGHINDGRARSSPRGRFPVRPRVRLDL